ncbi:MAG: toll/interleukin-1 receptor domain-containing protein [Deltaproteobacteria bacterium]|nr:toll/interleukin-1 receptor domain-containing protein [Deltaproteobacteria bacterium]
MYNEYDVILIHNSQDKPVVCKLANALKERGLTVWLDEWELAPGCLWQEVLEEVIEKGHVRAVAVLVGSEGIGLWQKKGVESFVDLSVKRGLPIIPVLLPKAPSEIVLPLFLQNFSWVDFRKGLSKKNINRLIWGITGDRSGQTTATMPTDEQLSIVAKQMGVTGGAPLDLYKKIADKVGVTEAALGNFFEIMTQQAVPPEKLDHTLREIARRYNYLQANLTQAATESEDDQVIALKVRASQALDQGDFDQAENLLNNASELELSAAEKILEALNKTAERQFLAAAASKAEAGDLKMTQLAYAAAADYYGRATELVPAGSELVRANYLHQQAGALYDAGKYAEVEPPLKISLDIRERLLEPNDPTIGNSLNSLAGLYHAQGKYDQAETLYLRALKIAEIALGSEHPTLAASLNNLARLYQAQGKYAQAEPLYQRALKIAEKALGPEHPHTSTTLNNLAGLYVAQGKYHEAEPLFQRALKIREKAQGPEHPDTVQSLNNLAALYLNQREYAQAEPLFQRALKIREQAQGPEHPDTAGTLNNLDRV